MNIYFVRYFVLHICKTFELRERLRIYLQKEYVLNLSLAGRDLYSLEDISMISRFLFNKKKKKNFFKDERKFFKIPNIKIVKYFMWKTIIFQIIYAQLQSSFTFRRISVNFIQYYLFSNRSLCVIFYSNLHIATKPGNIDIQILINA